MFRTKLPAKKTLLYTGKIFCYFTIIRKCKTFHEIVKFYKSIDDIFISVLAFVLWPILPLLAYILLLWRRPDDMNKVNSQRKISTISTLSTISAYPSENIKSRKGTKLFSSLIISLYALYLSLYSLGVLIRFILN